MVVSPHPDDAEIGAGGTIALWCRQGREVFYVICTNGDKGSSDPNMTSETLAKIRQQEQIEASKILGVSNVTLCRGYGIKGWAKPGSSFG